MDEHMKIVQDMVAVNASFSDDFDPDYEFDANRFFDFLKDETRSDAEEAENWFRYAREYPPSPFLVKLKLMKAAKINTVKAHITSSGKTEAYKINSNGDIDHKAASREMKIKDVKHHHNHIPQDNLKAGPKSTVNLSKPSGSSFMKPTASHLAKQNIEFDIHSGGYGRLQKPVVSAVEKLRSPIRIQNQTTKRQKLEIGYLRKAAQLKHRVTFVHKVSKKADQLESSSNSRAKTTIPKKPALATKERAQSCMSQNKSESLQRPLNRKVLDAPKLAQHKKNMIQSNEFQVLHKKNSASPVSEAMLVDFKRQSFGNAGNKDKCGSPNNLKVCTAAKVHPIKDGGFELNSKQNSLQPPTELFKKLSLKSEPETKVKQPHLTKGLKENVAGSYQQEFRRCVRKPNHYGTDTRITEVKI